MSGGLRSDVWSPHFFHGSFRYVSARCQRRVWQQTNYLFVVFQNLRYIKNVFLAFLYDILCVLLQIIKF